MPAEAKRQDTPSNPMPAVTDVREQDDHFIVTFADGQSTTVPKDGLKPETLAHIQGMAHGGEVRALAGGGVRVQSEGSSPGEEVSPAEEAAARARAAEEAEEARRAKPARREGEELPQFLAQGGQVDAGTSTMFQPLSFMGGVDAGMQPAPGGLPFPFTPGGAVVDPLLPNVSPAAMGATAAVDQAAPYAPAAPPPSGLKDMRGAAALAPTPPAPQPQPVAQPPPPPSGLPSGSGALTELNKGLAEQRAGLAAQVEVEKARDAALLQQQDAHIAQMQALEADYQERAVLTQRRADDLFMAVQNGRVDPNRVWANADLGQRIGAGIGIILSGIGVGLAGGPNLALQVIDRTIERDIDAQKANLETQKGLLAYYLQQGRDMMSAHQLAKADLKDMLAAQVARVSASFGGEEAAARAQLVGGQLRTEAAGKRQEIMARDFQMASARAAQAAEMERNRLLGLFTSAIGKPGGLGQGGEQLWELMPKDMRERRVRLPNGAWGLAKDAGQASKLQEGLEKVAEFKGALAKYTQILQSGSPRLWTGLGGDQTAAQQLRATLQALLKEAEALGAMSKGDYEFIDRQIPDISAWTTGKAAKEQGLGALGSTLDDRVASRLKTLGML